MKKKNWADTLLLADIDELRGIGNSETARLVRNDVEVRAVANRLLESLGQMHRSLEHVSSSAPQQLRIYAKQHSNRPQLVARLALGTCLAALLVFAWFHPGIRRTGAVVGVPPMTASLQADSDQPFAVFETDNPDIAIVWLFTKEDQP